MNLACFPSWFVTLNKVDKYGITVSKMHSILYSFSVQYGATFHWCRIICSRQKILRVSFIFCRSFYSGFPESAFYGDAQIVRTLLSVAERTAYLGSPTCSPCRLKANAFNIFTLTSFPFSCEMHPLKCTGLLVGVLPVTCEESLGFSCSTRTSST